MKLETTPERSAIMARIRSRDTGPELAMAALLDSINVKFERYAPLPGRPDFLLVGEGTVVFVHGCFWHGCPEHFREPKTNAEFWRPKIARNMERDGENAAALKALGFRVLIVWEHELRKRRLGDTAKRLIVELMRG